MKNKGTGSRKRKINAIQESTAHREGEEAPSGEEAGGDRLTKLPDELLLDILERVDTLDALRTCVLSKRVLKLPTMLSRFDINIGSLLRHHDTESLGYNNSHIVRYNKVVAGVTEKILSAMNPEIPIHKLRARFYMRHDECFSISKAFGRAMATQRVDNAEFVFHGEKCIFECTHDDIVCFAKQFNSCLGGCPAAFASLTLLWLFSMRFGEQDIPNILSICKRLEYLRLTYCDAGTRSVLQVEHAQLVELHIDHGQFEAVHLHFVPKLQRLTYVGWCYPDPLTFGYVPQFSTLSLEEIGISSTKNLLLSQFLSNIPSISDLHLDFRSEKIWVVPECPKLLAPVLGKLRTVNLDNLPEGCDIAWTMFILEAAPFLSVTVWDHWCQMMTDQDYRKKYVYCEKANVEWQPSAFDFKHKNLVKLTIYGFQPHENFVGYVRRFMEVAVNVREISLHDRKVCECRGDLDPKIKDRPSAYPTTSEEKDMLRVEITKELGMASPAVIHFRS